MALGDRLIALDGKAVASQADMVARLAAAGNQIVVDIDRRGRVIRLSLDAPQTLPGSLPGKTPETPAGTAGGE
jgi:hypothetical protein